MTVGQECPLCGAERQPAIAQAVQQLEQVFGVLESLRTALGMPKFASGGATLARAAAPWVQEVIAMIAAEHDVPSAMLLGDRRAVNYARPRFYLAWVLHQVGGYSMTRVGSMLGRDHSSIMNALRRVSEWRRTDDICRQHTDALLRRAQTIRDRSRAALKQAAAA
ncbi:MAG: helix-turn-helix domain-containing protein [Sphingomonadales bacterium]|jgi:hypothetical protein